MRKQNESDTYCWTREQILQMIKMCEHKQLTWLKNVIISLANTGLRIGELIQLNWDDTRSKPGFITIKDNSKSVSNISNSTRTTKTGKTRSLPISPELQILLNEIPYEKKGLIFRGPKGGKIKPDLLRRIFIKEVIQPLSEKYPSTKSEKGFKDGRLHSFRHYFCSVCANSNMPERVLKTWLGHASSDMVRRYYHLHDDDSQSKMN
jgi:integrase